MQTISQNLTRLQTAKTAIADAITAKGGTVSSGDGFEDFANDIDSIPTGVSYIKTIDNFQTFGTYGNYLRYDGIAVLCEDIDNKILCVSGRITNNSTSTISVPTYSNYPSSTCNGFMFNLNDIGITRDEYSNYFSKYVYGSTYLRSSVSSSSVFVRINLYTSTSNYIAFWPCLNSGSAYIYSGGYVSFYSLFSKYGV